MSNLCLNFFLTNNVVENIYRVTATLEKKITLELTTNLTPTLALRLT